MKDEEILAEAAKMVLTDKVPEQPFVRAVVTEISQTQYGMHHSFFPGQHQNNQMEVEIKLHFMVDCNDDTAQRILSSGRLLIMEDRLG